MTSTRVVVSAALVFASVLSTHALVTPGQAAPAQAPAAQPPTGQPPAGQAPAMLPGAGDVERLMQLLGRPLRTYRAFAAEHASAG